MPRGCLRKYDGPAPEVVLSHGQRQARAGGGGAQDEAQVSVAGDELRCSRQGISTRILG